MQSVFVYSINELELPGEEKKKRREAKAAAKSAGSGSGSTSSSKEVDVVKVVESDEEHKVWSEVKEGS